MSHEKLITSWSGLASESDENDDGNEQSEVTSIQSNSPSPAVVQEEIQLYQNNMSELAEDEPIVSNQEVNDELQHSSMTNVESTAQLRVRNETNRIEGNLAMNIFTPTVSSRPRNVLFAVVNVCSSCNHLCITKVITNLQNSVDVSGETNDSVVLTESAGTNIDQPLELSNEGNRLRADSSRTDSAKKRVRFHDTIMMSNDDSDDALDCTVNNVPEDVSHSIDVLPVENALNTDRNQTNATDAENAVVTDQIVSTSSNDNTERYNRDECQISARSAGKQNRKESLEVTVADETIYIDIDAVSRESEESLIDDCNHVLFNDNDHVDKCSKPLDDYTEVTPERLTVDIVTCQIDSPKDFTLIVSDDDTIVEFENIPSKELANVKGAVSDELIVLSDDEESSRSVHNDFTLVVSENDTTVDFANIPSRELPNVKDLSADKRSNVTISTFDNQKIMERIQSSSKFDLMKLYPALDFINNETLGREDPTITAKSLDNKRRFVDASIQTLSDEHATSNLEASNSSVIDLTIEPEVQLQEVLQNVGCKELKEENLEEETDGQSLKVTKKQAKQSNENILTAEQLFSSKKEFKKEVTNDDVYMANQNRKYLKLISKFALKKRPEQLESDRKVVKAKKRRLDHSYQTSTPIASTEKKAKYSLRQGFFGRSISNLRAKWREPGKKIKSKFGFKLSSLPKYQRTSAGNFSVTTFPTTENCEDVCGFSVIPT